VMFILHFRANCKCHLVRAERKVIDQRWQTNVSTPASSKKESPTS
jgi:hypothetical protein